MFLQHALWSAKKTRTVISNFYIQDEDRSRPGTSCFPPLYAVLPEVLIGSRELDFPLFLTAIQITLGLVQLKRALLRHLRLIRKFFYFFFFLY